MSTRKTPARTSSKPATQAPARKAPADPAKSRGVKPAAPPPSMARGAVVPAAPPPSMARAAVKPTAAPPPATAAKAEKTEKADKTARKARPALVRDGFTMPADDFALIAELKARALAAQRAAKKSELLRAGLHALAALDKAALVAALDRLAPVKTGRPKKGR